MGCNWAGQPLGWDLPGVMKTSCVTTGADRHSGRHGFSRQRVEAQTPLALWLEQPSFSFKWLRSCDTELMREHQDRIALRQFAAISRTSVEDCTSTTVLVLRRWKSRCRCLLWADGSLSADRRTPSHAATHARRSHPPCRDKKRGLLGGLIRGKRATLAVWEASRTPTN